MKAKQLIQYAVGDVPLEALLKQYIGLGNETPQSLIKHLRNKERVKLSAPDKIRYKNEGMQQSWDMTRNITNYFKAKETFITRCAARNITFGADEQVTAAVAAMYKSSYFTKSTMMEWEAKPDDTKTWVEFKSFFETKYIANQEYIRRQARCIRRRIIKQTPRRTNPTTPPLHPTR